MYFNEIYLFQNSLVQPLVVAGSQRCHFVPPPAGDGILEDVLPALRRLAGASPSGHHHHSPRPERFNKVAPYGNYCARIARGPHPAAPAVGSSNLNCSSTRIALSRIVILPKVDNRNRNGDPALAARDLPQRCSRMRCLTTPSCLPILSLQMACDPRPPTSASRVLSGRGGTCSAVTPVHASGPSCVRPQGP